MSDIERLKAENESLRKQVEMAEKAINKMADYPRKGNYHSGFLYMSTIARTAQEALAEMKGERQ